ncbi:MucBP domain-containing protein [Companilactobacillus zhachilii]|uniref:MucBP domain-containing protein n=1 Tax=Companilactobacillus zhachilii TaxID=2304606 RepID=UPI0040341658
MLLNKKCVYLGISLFSAMLLTATSTQEAKAATTTSTTTATTSPTSTSTSTTSTPAKTTTTSQPMTATATTSSTTTAPTATQTTTSATPVLPATTSTSSTTTAQPTTTTAKTTTATTGSTTTPVTTTSASSSTTSTTATPVTTTVTSSTSTTTPKTVPTTSTTTTTATTGTASTTTTSTVTTNPYAIPANVTDDTVITFTDPTLGYAVKDALKIPYNSNLTVGDIKAYSNPYLSVSMDNYDLRHPNGPASTSDPNINHMADIDSTPIESLDGMQYFQLLPAKAGLSLQVNLASDPKADPDLTPLENINLAGLDLAGNFSDPTAKEIDPIQVEKLNLSNSSSLKFEGTKTGNGITQAQLNQLAPTINKYANNGQGFNMIGFGNSSISDFSPLKGTETGKGAMINAVTNTINDPTPVYAVTGQPIAFTAPKLLDPSGTDIAPLYNYSGSTTSAYLKMGNLTNVGGDNFVLNNADPTATVLSYGNYGFHNGYVSGSMVQENLGNTYFQTATTVNQPLIFQAHPTVTINYVDATGKPIMVKGTALTKTLSGTTIGSAFDLTADSTVDGYKLTSPASLLKGTYTQNPQTVELAYSALPKKESSSTTTKPTKPVKPSKPIDKHPAKPSGDREQVVIHNTTDGSYLSDIGVHGTTTINGKPFYLLDDGELIEVQDYNTTASTKTGILITYESPVKLMDSRGRYLNLDSEPNTKWKYDELVAINGKGYYRIATDKYLVLDQATEFTPAPPKSKVHLTAKTYLYDSRGRRLRRALPANSYWRTDGYIMIHGIRMYRVATDEYVEAKLF